MVDLTSEEFIKLEILKLILSGDKKLTTQEIENSVNNLYDIVASKGKGE
jgi:hypothetical protein